MQAQLSKLNEKLGEKVEEIAVKEEAKPQETNVVQLQSKQSLALRLTEDITSKMPYADDAQKHKASQIITHLLAKISANPQVFGLFTDKGNIANSVRIVTQIVNLDLPFSGSEMYYLIPYGQQLSLQLSYQGMLEIAYRAGVYNVQVQTVFEGDNFSFSYGNNNSFVHTPAFDSDVPKFYYASCKLVVGKDSDLLLTVMSHKQMLAFKDKYSRGNPLWKSDFNNMAKKTVIKQLLKLCPKRPVDADLLQDDEVSE